MNRTTVDFCDEFGTRRQRPLHNFRGCEALFWKNELRMGSKMSSAKSEEINEVR